MGDKTKHIATHLSFVALQPVPLLVFFLGHGVFVETPADAVFAAVPCPLAVSAGAGLDLGQLCR